MSKLRILHVLESLGRAGAEQALVNVLPLLRAQGHVVELATLWPPDTLASELEARGVPVHRLDLNHRWNVAQGVSRLAQLCRQGHYDVLHGHSFFSGMYIALTRPFVPGVRRVLTFHNLGYDSYPSNTVWRKLRQRIESALVRGGIDVRLAVSPAVAAHYAEHLAIGPVTTLYNGISVEELRPLPSLDRHALLAPYGLSGDEVVLLVCGRLVHEKGHRYFLQALARLRDEGLRPKGLIVGNGPLERELVAEVQRLGLASQVVLHPAVPHRELIRLMQAAEVLVMSSTHEGFGLAPAEAMALGRPVVASGVGGLLDLIEHEVSGLLVAPRDPRALAEAIRRLLGDPALRQRLGLAGRARVEQNFSAQVAVEKLLGYYYASPPMPQTRLEKR